METITLAWVERQHRNDIDHITSVLTRNADLHDEVGLYNEVVRDLNQQLKYGLQEYKQTYTVTATLTVRLTREVDAETEEEAVEEAGEYFDMYTNSEWDVEDYNIEDMEARAQ